VQLRLEVISSINECLTVQISQKKSKQLQIRLDILSLES